MLSIFFFREMKIEKEIFSAATDSRFLREVINHLTLDAVFAKWAIIVFDRIRV